MILKNTFEHFHLFKFQVNNYKNENLRIKLKNSCFRVQEFKAEFERPRISNFLKIFLL
jgi:hypothetical protein